MQKSRLDQYKYLEIYPTMFTVYKYFNKNIIYFTYAKNFKIKLKMVKIIKIQCLNRYVVML